VEEQNHPEISSISNFRGEMNLEVFLDNIKEGHLAFCKNCPWNPQKYPKRIAFGVSCVEHGFDWTKPGSVTSMLIAQDPGGTTPARTGKLCGKCNTQSSTDHSANHGFSLWQAAVSLYQSGSDSTKYMKGHYWTNAIMHGFKALDKDNIKEREIENQREAARVCCTKILYEQIIMLSPKIIIATGKNTSESLFELNLISKRWDEFKTNFSQKVYCEQTTLPSGKPVTIYCTFHGSATAVNTHVARCYTGETKEILSRRIEKLPNSEPAKHFLRTFQEFNGEGRGMRVLLLHWLEIGEAIRLAYYEADFQK
jgi:hypothetical protein